MRPPCRSHAPGASWALPPFASPYVDTLDDAVFVVESSVGPGGQFGAVALLLDGDDRLLTAIECARCDSPARVVELCSVLLAAATSAGVWRRLVVASSLPAGDDVDARFTEAWASLAAACGPSPVDLVDWLLLDPASGVVRSLAEAVDGTSPW